MKFPWRDTFAGIGIGLILTALYWIWIPLFLLVLGSFIVYLACYNKSSDEKK